MTDMSANVLLVWRMNHSLFRNDRGDKIVGCHIECGIENADAFGRQRFAENMRDLFDIPLLDGNVLSRRTIYIDGGGRSGDIKRDAMPARQHGNRVGTDLVSDITVGSDSIAADHHGVDLASLH